MKNSFKSLSAILGILLVTFIPTMNAQDCGCGAALAKDKIESSDEGFDYLHSLSQITESEYETIKRSGDGGFKYKIISGSANYSEFKEKVRTEIYKTELETGSQYKSNSYEARTSPIAYEAWGKCMESCNKIGLILWIQNESKTSLALMLKYRPAPNSIATISYTVTIQHGDGSVEIKSGEILPNGSEPITVKRKCGSTNEISQTTISVKGAGYSTDWVSSKFYCGTRPNIGPITPSNDPFSEKMVFVAAGNFLMGSENGPANEAPLHSVSVPSFSISRYEVTQKEWQLVMGESENPSVHNSCPECPVENVSWYDVKNFIRKLNGKYPDKAYRLPTEAEWEFAATERGKSTYYKYSGSDNKNQVSWNGDNSGNESHRIGNKSPNALGIFDMSGNVWEWCEDWYHSSYVNAPKDGSAWLSQENQYKVVRGGSWVKNGDDCRVKYHGWENPNVQNDHIGFRLARSNR